jgi:hypothetical protein
MKKQRKRRAAKNLNEAKPQYLNTAIDSKWPRGAYLKSLKKNSMELIERSMRNFKKMLA